MASTDFSRTMGSGEHHSGFGRSQAMFRKVHLDLPLTHY